MEKWWFFYKKILRHGETDDHTNKSREAECIGEATSLLKKRHKRVLLFSVNNQNFFIYFDNSGCLYQFTHTTNTLQVQ